MSKRLRETESQRELIDAIADETTHLRAELNAVQAELAALRRDLRHFTPINADTAPSASRRPIARQMRAITRADN